MATPQQQTWQVGLAKGRQGASKPKGAAGKAEEAAGAAATTVANVATLALLRACWTAAIPSFGITFVFIFLYTIFYDLFGSFRGKLSDPIDALIMVSKGMGTQIPDFIKSTPRLLGRVFIIYPIGLLVTLIYALILVMIATLVFAVMKVGFTVIEILANILGI